MVGNKVKQNIERKITKLIEFDWYELKKKTCNRQALGR